MGRNKAPAVFRRKRGGKYVGSFVCVVDGRQVNLRTQNATEARQRARLLALGQWSPESGAADNAADAAIAGFEELPPPASSANATADTETADQSSDAPVSAVASPLSEKGDALDWSAAATEATGGTPAVAATQHPLEGIRLEGELLERAADAAIAATAHLPAVISWATGKPVPCGPVPPELEAGAKAILLWLGPKVGLERAGPVVEWCETHPVTVIAATLAAVGAARIYAGAQEAKATDARA